MSVDPNLSLTSRCPLYSTITREKGMSGGREGKKERILESCSFSYRKTPRIFYQNVVSFRFTFLSCRQTEYQGMLGSVVTSESVRYHPRARCPILILLIESSSGDSLIQKDTFGFPTVL